MDPVDQFRNRIAEALGGIILTLVATIGGVVIQSIQETAPTTEPATSVSINLITGLISSLPGIISFFGIIGATLIAGPFGLFGALFELVGANQILYYQSQSGFKMILFGAGLVTIGSPIPWMEVLRTLLDSGGRY